jgi:hypothetical protein
MAISTTAGSFFNDNMMTNTNTSGMSYERAMYEREMHNRQREEEYRRLQSWAITYTGQPMIETPKANPNDPLAFLKNADNKLLLTGESS